MRNVYIASIGELIIYCSTNRKAAYEALEKAVHEGDWHLWRSYAQYTRRMKQHRQFVIRGDVLRRYQIVEMPLHTKYHPV